LNQDFISLSTCVSTDHEETEATAAAETVGEVPGSAQPTPHLRCRDWTTQKPGLQSLPAAACGEARELDSSKSENCLLS